MLSISKLIIILVIVLIVCGAGKLTSAMGDIGKGIRNFRQGLNGEDETPQPASRVEVLPPQAPVAEQTLKDAQGHESTHV